TCDLSYGRNGARPGAPPRFPYRQLRSDHWRTNGGMRPLARAVPDPGWTRCEGAADTRRASGHRELVARSRQTNIAHIRPLGCAAARTEKRLDVATVHAPAARREAVRPGSERRQGPTVRPCESDGGPSARLWPASFECDMYFRGRRGDRQSSPESVDAAPATSCRRSGRVRHHNSRSRTAGHHRRVAWPAGGGAQSAWRFL